MVLLDELRDASLASKPRPESGLDCLSGATFARLQYMQGERRNSWVRGWYFWTSSGTPRPLPRYAACHVCLYLTVQTYSQGEVPPPHPETVRVRERPRLMLRLRLRLGLRLRPRVRERIRIRVRVTPPPDPSLAEHDRSEMSRQQLALYDSGQLLQTAASSVRQQLAL